ncbi:hypothetical protein V4C53_45595, partial [Paraburkholderia azotifigens]|uniref:hypothetical protein n=1 Tax=Paraburkholderia azotifigens TaxID=2057004 RepID=UPI00317E6C09
FLRLRGSPVFSLALYGIIQAGLMMLRFYTTRSIFAIPPSGQSPAIASAVAGQPKRKVMKREHETKPSRTTGKTRKK